MRAPALAPVHTASPARDARPGRLRRLPPELVLLTFLALATRMAAITHPRATVFDEVYFREFALRYREGSYFFDIHPPLGKLLLAGWGRLVGASGPSSTADPEVALRILPALAGTALIAVFYMFLRQIGASRRVATLGGALLLLDNAVLLESRLILLDSMLLLFGLGAVTMYLAAMRHTGRAHWGLLAGAATLAGMAAATKWTGLTAIGLIGLAWLARSIRARVGWRRAAGQGAILCLVPLVVYAGVFAVHFRLLTSTGPGDAFMSTRFQSTLTGSATYDPTAEMGFVDRFVELNKRMHSADTSLNTATHPYSSSWTSWPLLKRPIYYWTDGGRADGEQSHIYLQGNPAIWWGVIAGALILAFGWLRRPEPFARLRPAFALLAVAWAANYLPFAAIERPMFLYHYLFAFMFALAAVVLGVGVLAGWMTDDEQGFSFSSRGSARLYWGIIAVAAGGFLFFAPLSYGLPLSGSGLDHRLWLDSWR